MTPEHVYRYVADHVKRQTQGSHRSNAANPPGQSSLSAMVSTLIPVLLVATVMVSLFLVFRRKFRRTYQPRTFLSRFPEHEKTPAMSSGLFAWVKDFVAIPDTYVLNHQSLDGYLWLRFFRLMVIICFVGTVITWMVLFPINATGGGNGVQFGILGMSNIDIKTNKANVNRYYAHTFIAWIFFGFVMFMITRESMFFIHLRQAYLLSPYIASRMSSRTVVFTDVPGEYLDEERLRATFPGIRHVWIPSNTKHLEDLVKERNKVAVKLEAAEVGLSRAANQRLLKAEKARSKNKEDSLEDPMRWADERKRPTHRMKPLFGQKVDTIDWCREHLRELMPKVEGEQSRHRNGQAEHVPAVIVEFTTVEAAESAYQQLTHHQPRMLQARAIGARPQDIIWSNLNKGWTARALRRAGATAIIAFMVIFWALITAFIGLLSNIDKLDTISFLTWIQLIPKTILGLVTGLLPTILLAVAMALVPIIMRLLARMMGCVTTAEVELQTQNWYFMFQVVQVFLITTFASGAASVGKKIAADPSSAPALLATNLPTASQFYISYFILLGIGTFGGALLNYVSFLLYILLGSILDKTPRKKYNRFMNVAGLGWGSVYPVFTNIAVISITYSIIAPLVLGFATVGFLLIYIAFRYNMLFTLDTTNLNMQGQAYARALQHLTVGVYLGEICLVGLFIINASGSPAGAGPAILMVIFLIATILFHLSMRSALQPLRRYLPRDLLADNTRESHADTRAGENGQSRYTVAMGQEKQTVETRGSLSPTPASRHPAMAGGIGGLIYRCTHPSRLPAFVAYLAEPLPDYPEDVRREAYVDAAVSSPAPLLWIVHDDVGLSARAKEESGRLLTTTDRGAWWEEKTGKLRTAWEQEGMADAVREAPIWEDKIEY